MFNKLLQFFKGTYPQGIQWEEVSREIKEVFDNMKVKFEITPYYYKVISGKRTWYWKLENGEFDGTSWDY